MSLAVYSSFLHFVATQRPELLPLEPCARVDAAVAADYVLFLRQTCRDTTIAGKLSLLGYLLRAFEEGTDWSWLQRASRRIRRQAPHVSRPRVTSDHLYALGLDLMTEALAEADGMERVSLAQAIKFREGLMIAFLAEIPLRLGSLVKLCIGTHLVRDADRWSLDIPGEEIRPRA